MTREHKKVLKRLLEFFTIRKFYKFKSIRFLRILLKPIKLRRVLLEAFGSISFSKSQVWFYVSRNSKRGLGEKPKIQDQTCEFLKMFRNIKTKLTSF